MASDARTNFVEAQRRTLESYGVDAKSLFVETSIVGQAHVLISGGAGPPVIMLSGIGTPSAIWAPLMAELKGLRLHAVDLPGYGLTDGPPGFAGDLRNNAVSFLTEVLERLELRSASFIGNSMGSLWISWLALDRVRSVQRVVHIGCPAVVLDSSAPLPMRMLAVSPLGRLMTRLQPPSEQQVEDLSRMVNQHPLPATIARLLLATERMPAFEPMFLSTLHELLRLRGSRPQNRLTEQQLEQIPQPTLLIWGENDPFGSLATGERMARAMPHAELHPVEGGHAPWLTKASAIGQRATRFLKSTT